MTSNDIKGWLPLAALLGGFLIQWGALSGRVAAQQSELTAARQDSSAQLKLLTEVSTSIRALDGRLTDLHRDVRELRLRSYGTYRPSEPQPRGP